MTEEYTVVQLNRQEYPRWWKLRVSSCLALDSHDAIISPLLDDLAKKTCRSKESTDNLTVELEAIGSNQRDVVFMRSSAKVTKQDEGVAIASFPHNGGRLEARANFDGE